MDEHQTTLRRYTQEPLVTVSILTFYPYLQYFVSFGIFLINYHNLRD
jgi:hypothetical protein